MTNCLAKRDLEAMDLSNVDEARKNEILRIKDSIAFNYDATQDFASAASKNLTEFSSDLLKTVKMKDAPDVENLMTELLTNIEKVDATTLQAKKPTFIQRVFGTDQIKSFIRSYEDVETVIHGVRDKLEVANFELKKDIVTGERLLRTNLSYINALDNHIMAGKLRAQEEQAAIDAERANLDPEDQLMAYNLKSRQDELDRFSRKIFNLLLMREIAVQNVPQILLINNNSSILIEKIDSSINSTIPLWEQQMVIAIQLMRQRGALALQESVTKTTNNLIEKNGEMLRTNSVAVAKSLEAGVVDVEVLKKNSQNLIQTIKEIKAVQADGKKQRLEAARQLGALQSELNEQLLLTAGE
jgi:uncharacterized protein YaaN involved in tellurite resistance